MAQDRTESFGYWLRRRRKALDLTQTALAERACCSCDSIRKIEADLRRPSRHLAERLATSLAIPDAERRAFLAAARAVGSTGRLLAVSPVPVGPADHGAAPDPAATPLPLRATAGDAAPFVGRDREYAVLTGFMDRLGAGPGQTVLLEGEPGIGKSRLMRELARHAQHRGLPAFGVKCYEIERAMPYQPVVELIAQALARVPDATLRALAPVRLAEIANLVPELTARLPDLPVLSSDFPEARQARLPRAVGSLLDAARGGHPALLVVDDIQWADDASIQVFHYLARQAAANRGLAIYAYRDEDLRTERKLARLIGSLCREAGARRLTLGRLHAADTASVVEALAPPGAPAALAARLYRETDGNPFFLISILESLGEGEIRLDAPADGTPALLPEALREAVRARLARVPKALRGIVEVAAVLGRCFDFTLLLEVTGEPEARLSEALEALVQRRLLHEEPAGGRVEPDLALVEPNGLREYEARARRWRGEALVRAGSLAAAADELLRAAALARNVGRVRLVLDTERALARLWRDQGRPAAARAHEAQARTVAAAIEARASDPAGSSRSSTEATAAGATRRAAANPPAGPADGPLVAERR